MHFTKAFFQDAVPLAAEDLRLIDNPHVDISGLRECWEPFPFDDDEGFLTVVGNIRF